MEQLKAKYENLKTKARKVAAHDKSYVKGTGGGPPQYPEEDPVIKAVLRVINEKTVVGFNNPFDSDSAPSLCSVTSQEPEQVRTPTC